MHAVWEVGRVSTAKATFWDPFAEPLTQHRQNEGSCAQLMLHILGGRAFRSSEPVTAAQAFFGKVVQAAVRWAAENPEATQKLIGGAMNLAKGFGVNVPPSLGRFFG